MKQLIAARVPCPDTRKWRVLLGVSIASFLGCLDFTIVNTVIPDIQANLHATVGQSQWIISLFLIALCACMVLAGRLADLYGRRLFLYLGMIAFGVSSLGAGCATNIDGLIAVRVVQGVSCAALYTASAAIISNAFAEAERGKAMGVLFGINGIGLAIGPVAGGMLVSAFGWRAIFLVNVPFIVLSFAICLSCVRESRNTVDRAAIDWRGLILFVAALPALLLGITQGMAWGWTSIKTWACFGAAFVLFAQLFRVERTAASPIIDITLFFNREFIAAGTATFFLAFFYCAAFFLMPLYLKVVGHFNDFRTGMMLLPTTAVMALASPLVGRATDRVGARPMLVLGFLCFAASAAMQAQFSELASLTGVVTSFALMGLGWACILGPSTVSALSSVPDHRGGVAMGATWTLHNLGGAIGVAVATMVYQIFAKGWISRVTATGAWDMPSGLAQSIAYNPAQAASQFSAISDLAKVSDCVAHGFVYGYRASMYLLLAVSLVALCIALAGKSSAPIPCGEHS